MQEKKEELSEKTINKLIQSEAKKIKDNNPKLKELHEEVKKFKEEGSHNIKQKINLPKKLDHETICEYIKTWAEMGMTPQTIISIKAISKLCDFTIVELKQFVKTEINEIAKEKKKLEKEKKLEFIGKKRDEFKESNFLFSGFNQFTNYLDVAEDFFKQQPFYYDKYKIWWLWNCVDKRWERIDDIDLINAIDKYTQNPSTNLGIKYEILEALKRVGRKHKPKEASPTWVQFKDIIYDIKTEVMFEAKPEYFITNPIPWTLGKSSETPIIDKILKEWVFKEGIQDESYVKTLKQIMAYSLLSYMPIHRIFCLIGEGLNGKGTYLRLIENLVGSDNCCATEIEILTSNRFESNKLYKKLVCFVGEVDRGIFKKTKTIKSLTGEDTVRVEFKGKDSFDGKNYANPIIATNHLPETSDKTKGFYRRWTIVDFPNRFSEKKNILDDIPEEEYNNFCKQALKILKGLLEAGEFENDGTIEEREDKYEKHSNHINEFIERYCIKQDNSYIIFNEFCNRYNEYLTSEGLNKKSKIEIGRSLNLKGFHRKIKKVNLGLYPTTKMSVIGIKWGGEIEEFE